MRIGRLSMNKNFNKTFHYFRAFAIFSVLGAHIWFSPVVEGLENQRQMLECLRSVLFHSSTIYFIFISGYLFDFIYKNRPFDLLSFYRSKVKNVLCPYVFLSTIFIVVSMILSWKAIDIPPFINHATALTAPKDIVRSYLWGTACVTYWYIPFILTVYAVSPLLFRIKGRNFILFTAAVSVLPLFIQRDELVDFFRNYCFFYPVFILGVFFSRHEKACLDFLTRNWMWIALLSVVASVGLGFEYYDQRLPSVEIGYYIQRLAIGALVIVALEKLDITSSFLDIMARYSFPLYFLHDVVAWAVSGPLHAFFLSISGNGMVLTTMMTFAVELALCMCTIYAVKKLTGQYSRRLIGG